MAIVLQVGLLLDPNNQIAHLVDFTGLTESIEYVISAPFLQADTRFTFQGHFDIALTRPPVGVPQSQTEVPATISTVPTPAAATPPARYPYVTNDRLIASNLNLAFDFDPGVVPPAGNGGGAGRFKYWVDTSGTLPVLRQCVANPRATPGAYVPSQWIELGSIDAAANKFHFNTDHVDFGGGTTPISVGAINATGQIATYGTNAGFAFADRGNPAVGWLWYSNAGSARLYFQGADKVTVDGSGGIVTNGIMNAGQYQIGGRTFAGSDGFTTVIYDPSGEPAIFLQSVTSYFDANAIVFRNNATVRQAVISGGNLTLDSGYVYLAGGSGSVNTTGGPLLYADTSNHVYKQGPGNGSWLFQNYAGTNVANINSSGVINGSYIYAANNMSCWDISVGGTVTTQVVTASSTVTGAYVRSTGNVQADNAVTTPYVHAGAAGVLSDGNIGTPSTVTASYVHSTGHIDADTYVYAPDGFWTHDAAGGTTYRMYSQGTLSWFQFAGTYAWQWNGTNGQLTYIAATEALWNMRVGDFFAFNDVGTVGGHGSYSVLSDRRSKTDIYPTTKGLAEILQLNPVEFTRVHRVESMPSRRELGFVAQDVLPVLSEAVRAVGMTLPDGSGSMDDEEPSLSLTYDTITACLVNAVKELNTRLIALE